MEITPQTETGRSRLEGPCGPEAGRGCGLV